MRRVIGSLAALCLSALACSDEPTFTDGGGTGATGGHGATSASGGDGGGATGRGGAGATGTGAASTGGDSSTGGTPPTGGGSPTGEGGAGGGIVVGCGDGTIDIASEECDDGNQTSGDGCSGCVVDCPPSGFKDPATFHCYFIEGSLTNWSNAVDECADTTPGTMLAVLADEDEFTMVVAMLNDLNDSWLGAHDMGVEDDYEWINGEPWTFGAGGGYPWAAGQPNDIGSQDCVAVGYEDPADLLGLFDRQCGSNLEVLCEREPLGQ